MENDFNILYRLADTALTLGILGIGLFTLYKRNLSLETRNQELIDKMHMKDLENIKTLELISRGIENIEKNERENITVIKTHIDERTRELKEEIRRYDRN